MPEQKPRITFSLSSGRVLEIYVNEEGKAVLARAISGLTELHDHVHFSPDGDFGLQSNGRPYRSSDTILEWVKIIFRPDSWDREHYPHVFDG